MTHFCLPNIDVPDPFTLFGIPYTSVTLTTPDKVSLAAYFIPARPPFEVKSLLALRSAAKAKQGTKGNNEKEIVDPVAAEGKLSKDGEDYVKSRPTVIMYHANAGKPRWPVLTVLSRSNLRREDDVDLFVGQS